MKVPGITVSLDPTKPGTPWRVNVPANVALDGVRFRRYFVSRAAADRFAAEQDRAARNHTDRALALTEGQREEAARCIALVAPHGRTLTDAVNEALSRWQLETASVPLDDVRAALLAVKGQDKRSAPHLAALSRCLARFCEAFPGRLVASIQPAEVDDYLRGLPVGGISRDSYRTLIGVAFAFAVRRGWAKENPIKLVEKAGGTVPEARIIAPEALAALLAAADPRLLPWLALGAFGGLRPAEATRVPWRNVGPAGVLLTADITKVGARRVVPMLPALAGWIEPERRDRAGAVGLKPSTHRRLLRRAWKAAGWKGWPKDGLRKSFISYRFALTLNENQVASEAGNSPGVVHKYYRALTDAATAERWFALRPAKTV